MQIQWQPHEEKLLRGVCPLWAWSVGQLLRRQWGEARVEAATGGPWRDCVIGFWLAPSFQLIREHWEDLSLLRPQFTERVCGILSHSTVRERTLCL
jgi:hypothetical protein